MKIEIGRYIDDQSKVEIDLDSLIDTRILVQANSGGGKSYALRKLMEETNGKVQQIVLDIEGEFSTLREKYDYLLVGRDGDIPINIKSASLLAQKILELGVSTIIDLYELKQYERILFMKRFLESLVEAPKELWHPVLVFIDETHLFCPENGKSESASSVIDLCTRGRKRGFCAVIATQRLSKLNKDAAAECNNKLLGRTGLDVDRKRVSEELGFTSKEQNLSLRNLKEGEFYVFGTAVSQEVRVCKIGRVKTTHPKRGQRILKNTTKPTKKIANLIKTLTDLPKEAEKELKTNKELREEIHNLKMEIRKNKTSGKIDEKEIERIRKEEQRLGIRRIKETEQSFSPYVKFCESVKLSLPKIERLLHSLEEAIPLPYEKKQLIKEEIEKSRTDFKAPYIPPIQHRKSNEQVVDYNMLRGDIGSDKKIGGGALRILKTLAMFYPKEVSRARIGLCSNLSYKSGSFKTYLSTLRSNSLIIQHGDNFTITPDGLQEAGHTESLPTNPHELIDMWATKVGGGAGRILRVLADAYPMSLTKEEAGLRAGLVSTSGSFKTYLSTLRSNGLITVSQNEIKATAELFGDE